jgi:hypothetical protein
MREHLMPRRLRLLVGTAVTLLVAGLGADASAGGWAVASLDAAPDVAAGEPTEVGFTILQHGESPVNLTGDVGIEIVLPDGTTEFFPAVNDALGHYVATVTIPDEGSYAWNVHMDWFGVQHIGRIDVAASDVGGSSGSGLQRARWGMLAGAVALGLVAVVDFTAGRRRRLRVTAA